MWERKKRKMVTQLHDVIKFTITTPITHNGHRDMIHIIKIKTFSIQR